MNLSFVEKVIFLKNQLLNFNFRKTLSFVNRITFAIHLSLRLVLFIYLIQFFRMNSAFALAGNSDSLPKLNEPPPAMAEFHPPRILSNEDDIRVPAFWEMITDLPSDLKEFGRLTIDKKNLPILVGVLGMTAITVVTDYESWLAARIPTNESEDVRQFSNMGVSMGDGFFQFSIVGVFAASGAALGNRKFLRTASQITESILATGIVVQIIKHVTGRESPFSSDDRRGVWRLFHNQLDYHLDFQNHDAMPSGHLSTAVTTFIVIQENFPEQKWIPFIGWPVMGWIAFGLAGTNIHWWSDYPIAVALGYSFAKIITRDNGSSLKKIGRRENSIVPELLPSFSMRGEPMVALQWQF